MERSTYGKDIGVMKWLEGVEQINKSFQGSVVTLGSFDGLHQGHQCLINQCLDLSEQKALSSVLFTFFPHPSQVLSPKAPTLRLFDDEDQKEQLAKKGVDWVIQQKFTKELSQLSAEEFLNQFLLNPLGMRALVVGYDFSIGKGRCGDQSFLKEYCLRNQIELHILAPYMYEGKVVSSSRIREAIKKGNLRDAEAMLGRHFYLKGHVLEGFQRGRTIGFPTANLSPISGVLPKTGVYATKTWVDGRGLPSVTNIGVNPTFEKDPDRPVKVESHILNWTGDLYGKEIRVELLKYIREEKKFENVDELVAQINLDIKRIGSL